MQTGRVDGTPTGSWCFESPRGVPAVTDVGCERGRCGRFLGLETGRVKWIVAKDTRLPLLFGVVSPVVVRRRQENSEGVCDFFKNLANF